MHVVSSQPHGERGVARTSTRRRRHAPHFKATLLDACLQLLQLGPVDVDGGFAE
jgi:hypothetical protein